MNLPPALSAHLRPGSPCRAMLVALLQGLAGLLLGLSLAGCLSAAPVREVRFYDLGPAPAPTAQANPAPAYLRVAAFEAAWPSRQRLVRRVDGFAVVLDEYHRWLAPPEALLAARLRAAAQPYFRQVGGDLDAAGDLTLEGRLLAFEQRGEEAVLHLELTLLGADREPLWRRLYEDRQPLAAGPPESAPTRLVAALAILADRCAAACLPELNRVAASRSAN